MELDNKWIENYETQELDYNDFYKDDVKYIKTYSLHINRGLILENINEENFILETNNVLKKHELISIINKYKNDKKEKKVKLLSILKYNISLDSDNVFEYLKQETENNLFLESVKSIDNINFDPSISMFEDLNSLFFIFVETNNTEKSQTKRIFLHSNQKKTKKRK
jgi:hypothetical protein